MLNSDWGGKWGADHCRKVIRTCGGRLEKLMKNDVAKYEKKRDFMEVYGEPSHCWCSKSQHSLQFLSLVLVSAVFN